MARPLAVAWGMRACVFLLAAAMCGLASGASAQEAVRVSLGATVPLAGRLGPVWDAQPGVRGSLAFLAYGGETRLLLELDSHTSTNARGPDFSAVTAMLGWGPVVQAGPVRLVPGAEVGAGRYDFEDDSFGDELEEESEVVAGAYLRASVPLAGRVEAWAETGVRRTFFSTVATTASARGGLSVRL